MDGTASVCTLYHSFFIFVAASNALDFQFLGLSGLALGNKNNLYISGYNTNSIYRMDLILNNITRVAGTGQAATQSVTLVYST
jgi:hypothetical protein